MTTKLDVSAITIDRPYGAADAPIEITFRAEDGSAVTVALDQRAQTQLRAKLLANRVARREGRSFLLATWPQRIVGFTAFTWNDTLGALELRMSEREAMHVCFDAHAGEELVDALRWLANHLPDEAAPH